MNPLFVSINNGQVIKDAITSYEYTILGKKWGDILFFKHFILYNGQPHIYMNSSDLKYSLTKILDGNNTLRNTWVENSSNDQLRELYKNINLTIPEKNVLVE